MIGRIIYDKKIIFEEKIEQMKKERRKFGKKDDDFDLEIMVEGMEDESEKGIKIDVDYSLLQKKRRKLIVEDKKGNEKYKRNMEKGD